MYSQRFKVLHNLSRFSGLASHKPMQNQSLPTAYAYPSALKTEIAAKMEYKTAKDENSQLLLQVTYNKSFSGNSIRQVTDAL